MTSSVTRAGEKSATGKPGKTDKPVIRVLQHLARTGGTLIARCLACMDKTRLFSETHPSGFLPEDLDFFDIMVQAQRWHGLITEDELQDWLANTWPLDDRRTVPEPDPRFLRAVALLHERCAEHGLHLLLRDWPHVDYTGKPFPFAPCFRPRLVEMLDFDYRVRPTATVRHPVRSYVSLLAFMPELKVTLSPVEYSEGCLRFAQYAREIGFIRYEDFLQDPDRGLRTLCDHLELPFDPDYTRRWMHYDKVTGDRSKATEIRRQPPRPVAKELLRAFEACDAYHQTLALLGYETY